MEPQSGDCLTMDIIVPDGGFEGMPVDCIIYLYLEELRAVTLTCNRFHTRPDYIVGRELSRDASEAFLSSMLSAYPMDPSVGGPNRRPKHHTRITIPIQTPLSHRRRRSLTAPCAWNLKAFSGNKKSRGVWGVVFDEAIPSMPEKLGV